MEKGLREKIMTKTLLDQYEELLKEYKKEVEDVIEECAQDASEFTLKLVKSKSPFTPAPMRDSWRKGKAHYRTGWKVEFIDLGGLVGKFIIHNANEPTLTHLLENGHAVAPSWQHRFGKRVEGKPHIKPSEEAGAEYYHKLLVDKISKMG